MNNLVLLKDCAVLSLNYICEKTEIYFTINL